MRLSFSIALICASLSTGAAFVPSKFHSRDRRIVLKNTVDVDEQTAVSIDSEQTGISVNDVPLNDVNNNLKPNLVSLTAEEINARMAKQMEKLREKDRSSKQLSKEDLKIVFEDDHIVIVDKPSGVLCVPSSGSSEDASVPSSLAQVVFDSIGCEKNQKMDQMVVHRLGMDTSGLVVFAKTMAALRGMNTIFRSRKIDRQYEALLCGHVEKDGGIINLPLMRDYEYPPFMRVSTNAHQTILMNIIENNDDSSSLLNKKLLQAPKESLTKYTVMGREEYKDLPVSRVTLTSISGRTHQLNVHCAAFGHAILGDRIYGIDGDAAPNGGLLPEEQQNNRADEELQKKLAALNPPYCVHAKSLKFRHPVTKEEISVSSDAPF